MEFIDEMFERLMAQEYRSFGEACEEIIKAKATQIVDLGKIENGYQLFRKRHPISNMSEGLFREYIKIVRPEDYKKCVHSLNWK